MGLFSPRFDELYVISDIHMGGRQDGEDNFQIFNRGERLGAFVRHIAGSRSDDDVALVLNGDIIDSLAEDVVPSYVALDAPTAVKMMEHIYSDSAFKPVWDALATFIGTPKRHLVFVVGNHDIELSLPVVEDSIRRRLAQGSGEASARIHFHTHGSGFGCQVGSAGVFCTHGNELDEWNWVDYNVLGQLSNAMSAGRGVGSADWKPNAGTRLVVDVMNDVKRRYPFVDLLKPEVAAVASVLISLDRDVLKKIDFSSVFPVLRDKIRGGLVTKKLLGEGVTDLSAASSTAVAEEVAQQLLGPSLRAAVEEKRLAGPSASEDDLLLEAEEAVADGRVSAEAASREGPEILGGWDLFAGWVGLVRKEEGLRRALEDWLKEDQTFAVEDPEDHLYKDMKSRVSDTVNFVVTGHTHKPRAMRYDNGCYYYNCGTWIRTLRLTEGVLADSEAFRAKLWPVLESGRMGALDTANIPGPNGEDVPLVFDRTNAVRISMQDGRVSGDLLRVTDGPANGVRLEPEPGTSAFTVA